MFDTLLQDVETRFGISGEKAKQLLGMLIALIFNEKRGGPAGFVDLFRSKGLGDAVTSWIGNGPNHPIDPAQLESALGSDVVTSLADRAGLDRTAASGALAAMLPGVFHTLTEDGRLPMGGIPDRISHYTHGIGDFIHSLGAGALGAGAATAGAVGATASRMGSTVDSGASRAAAATREVARDSSSGIGKILPWLLLGALVLIGLFALNRCKKAPEPAPAPTATETPAPAPATAGNPKFAFDTDGAKANISGMLSSDAEKSKLLAGLKAAFGDGNVVGDVTVDAKTAPAGWLDTLVALLPQFKAKGLKFDFDGNKLHFDTSAMSDADRVALMTALNGAFDGVEVSGLDAGSDALSALKEGFTAADLVKALDLMNIRFKTGSADISPASLDLVKKAAEYMKKAPAGTKIEVAGHTDNVGNAASNLKLSDARANAVMAKLAENGVDAGMLTAKGYGDTKPVADNATDEGRAKNRRIEYTVVQ